ncbi:prepilin-type N-terminal cleavage/methylation domain-containing protein [uncultured Clostridium sp.]|uniref:prepilin-type N-terminal cleavage/methylation domain-containing protein n=1 Tax=uncultured Clostridium sp. TaxID=59620 RepID=UPI0026228595|nr:prepilin-type N-terminal cleavage/methylation domain-containing protein [uncultured Clostridium sp.]
MKKKGFTLVEVIAVMAITSIIIITIGSFFLNYSKVDIQMKNSTINENYYNIAKSKIINLAYNKNIINPKENTIMDSSGNIMNVEFIIKEDNKENLLCEINNEYYIYMGVTIKNGVLESYLEKNKLENVGDIKMDWNSKSINTNLLQVDLTININKTTKTYEFSLIKS